jgi:hypothetical protein
MEMRWCVTVESWAVFPDDVEDEKNEEDEAEQAFYGVFLAAAAADFRIGSAIVFAVGASGHGGGMV